MRKVGLAIVWIFLFAIATSVAAQDHRAEARAADEEYFRAWNAEANEALADVSNFPRLSLGRNGQVVVREGPEDIEIDFEILRQVEGWDHSTLDLLEALQVSPDTVHFKVVFSRRHADGAAYRTVPSLFIITKQNDHWGLQMQSMLPVTFQGP